MYVQDIVPENHRYILEIVSVIGLVVCILYKPTYPFSPFECLFLLSAYQFSLLSIFPDFGDWFLSGAWTYTMDHNVWGNYCLSYIS